MDSTDLLIQALLSNGSGGGATGKADKVQNATAGDLASLSASGNLTDSGVSVDDVNGKMDKVDGGTQGNLISLDLEGNAQDSGISASLVESLPSLPETNGDYVLKKDSGGLSYASADYLNQTGMVAGAYSPPYSSGDYCTYNNTLYMASVDIPASEVFTLSHWTPVTLGGELEKVTSVEKTRYGFHIDSNEADPSACVTYLADSIGMTPAHMDFANDRFDWGSWKNAFFIPRPCMLKYDGTVDYYLDPNDYSKKEDGTPSDVANFAYGGNAMVEWGRDGKKIWYKIVPDSDPTSASVYIADYQADENYRAWSFVNNQGVMVDHFYTPAYNGSIDADGRLRSLSGVAAANICQGKTGRQEIDAAKMNNPGDGMMWYTEVFADINLINLLLILMGKSRNGQKTFGNGVQGGEQINMIGTGMMNAKGLFWGSNDNTHGVKVFGMENWWGNQNRRYGGHVLKEFNHYFKMTWGTEDGSSAVGYNSSGTGYKAGGISPTETGMYIVDMQFNGDAFFVAEATASGTQETNWCDSYYVDSGNRYPYRGGATNGAVGGCGPFRVNLNYMLENSYWNIGAALSCKPLAQQSESETEG